MHPKIYNLFGESLAECEIRGSVLEIGTQRGQMSLLKLPVFDRADRKLGVNLDGPFDFDDINVAKGSANHMQMFPDGSIECVLCNAVLEHDKKFWLTLRKINRVSAPNGLLAIGTPSYKDHMFAKYTLKWGNDTFLKDFLRNATFCYHIHDHPVDYYRFSEETYLDVFFEGYHNIKVRTIMTPPRTVGWGYKA